MKNKTLHFIFFVLKWRFICTNIKKNYHDMKTYSDLFIDFIRQCLYAFSHDYCTNSDGILIVLIKSRLLTYSNDKL